MKQDIGFLAHAYPCLLGALLRSAGFPSFRATSPMTDRSSTC